MTWAGAQRAYHQRRNAKQLQPLNDNDDDEFNAYRATMAGFMEDDLMTIEATAARLTGLANVVSVEVANDAHLYIVATPRPPFEAIAKLTAGVPVVDVSLATPVPEDAADRFRATRHFRDLYTASGEHQTPDAARLMAGSLGIETPPTLGAIYRGTLGVLFASLDDAAAFDLSEAQHVAREAKDKAP